MKKLVGTALALAIIFLTGLLFNYKTLNEFPSHIHAWAQSDRYALALGFVRNDLNFFDPQTYVLNHQFPGDWKVASGKSITAVDFPVHDYIPAVIMKISGNRSPWIFRLYILLYSFAGLFFLYRLSLLLGNGSLKSLFLVLLAATSPVFAYYQGGFLPSIPSLSNAIIGIYFYLSYVRQNRRSDRILAYVFLTLSALSRLPFVIPLAAVYLAELLRFKRKTIKASSFWLPALLSVLAVTGKFIYNSWLSAKYGSIFLNHIMPPDGFRNGIELIQASLKNWGNDYFNSFQWLIFFMIFLASAFFILRKKQWIKPDQKIFLQFLTAFIAGESVFSVLMLKQFPNHDYYFLDTFFLPVILMIAFGMTFIPVPRKIDNRVTLAVLLMLAGIFLVKKTLLSEESRRRTGYWDRNMTTINNFTGSSAFLDSLGVPRDAKVIVADSYAPNIPFILMDREGYAVMSPDSTNLKNALDWGAGYFVAQEDFFIPETYAAYPGILSRINRIADNGKIMVCRIRMTAKQRQVDLISFYGLQDRTPVMESRMDFDTDTLDYKNWHVIHPDEKYSYSGMCSGHLSCKDEYGPTFSDSNLNDLAGGSRILVCSAWFLADNLKSCKVVAAIRRDDKNIFYKSSDLGNFLKSTGRWEQATFIYRLPRVSSGHCELTVYLWNDGRGSLYCDDFYLKLY